MQDKTQAKRIRLSRLYLKLFKVRHLLSGNFNSLLQLGVVTKS